MVAFPRLSQLIPPRLAALLPVGGGGLAALAAGGTIALLRVGVLERLVWTSGVAALIPAAQPPLGVTARALLALGAGVGAGAVAWSALFLLFGPGGFLAPRGGAVMGAAAARAPRAARLRRADRHPDAPPRPPMTAADLGTPLMEVPTAPPPAVQPLPADLDQPLAAFDPAALPLSPLEPVRPVAPLAPRFAAGERIETFELTPLVRQPAARAPDPVRRKDGPAPSIDSLLRRLEESAGRRAPAG